LSGGPFEGGGQVRQLVSLVDLPPTLLDACGIDIPDAMEGRSILPLLRGEAADWPEEVFVQISESHTGRAVRTGRWKYSVGAPAEHEQDGSSDVYEEQFLYDLKHDPYELCNIIDLGSHAPVRARMRQRLLRRMREAGEPEPRIIEHPVADSGQRIVLPEEIDQ
jgi:arylsulfatase A-like enzyme